MISRADPAPSAVFVLLGAFSLASQVLLVRECFALYSGNELWLAIQLGLWLSLTAAGGFLGAVLPARASGPLLACLPLAGVGAVVLVRLLPLWLPVPVGAEIPFGWALVSLAAAQLPLNLVAGALFPTACRRFAGGRQATAIGRFYMLEASGGAGAGGLFTVLLAGNVRGLDCAVWLAAGASAVAVAVLWRRSPLWRWVGAGIGALLAAWAVLGHPARTIDGLWWGNGSTPIVSIESRYQRIDLAAHDGQHTLYLNGMPAVTLEDRESASGYRRADLYLSLHPDPRRVLIIGSGEPGLPARMLEYPAVRATYVLLDPAVLAATPATVSPWDDPRLTVVEDDGRRYLQATERSFELIVLDLPPPISATGNRFFTSQPFRAVRSRLAASDGLLVFRLPSSGHFIAGETEMLLASIYRALEGAFGEVHVLAGESMTFLAGPGAGKPSLAALSQRFAEREVPMSLGSGRLIETPEQKAAVFCALFETDFDPFRRTRQLDQLLTTEVAANSDERPIAYALNLRRWLREVGVNPQLLERTVRMADTGVRAVRRRGVLCTSAAAVVLTVALVLVARNRRRGARKVTLAMAVATSGWAGMMGELAIVFMYQNAFGRLYHAIGGLFAVYMLGLAAGSKLTSGRAFTMAPIRALMICSSLVGLALSPSHSSVALFAVLFCYAFALGMEYPVANRLYLREGGSAAAGVLHGMDHLGAAVATWIGGTLLLPLIGARSILVAVVAVHLVVLGPLALLFRVGRLPRRAGTWRLGRKPRLSQGGKGKASGSSAGR
ncbi:MAG: hypothetical protein GY856_03265 [bacterium]|nr:hypothetical protein [bacterium]